MLTLEQIIYFIHCYGTGEQSYRCVNENEEFPYIQVSQMVVHKLFISSESVTNLKKQNKTYDEEDAATFLVLESVQGQPKSSPMRWSLQMGKSDIQRIFKDNEIYLYKPKLNHTLEPAYGA